MKAKIYRPSGKGEPHVIELPDSVLVKKQRKKFTKTVIDPELGKGECKLTCEIRYDDCCGNGHNSFAITGEGRDLNGSYSGGCMHDTMAKHFPEFAKFIKWHLTSSTGPMHYLGNTIYQAGERDYNGLLKGEKRQLVNGRSKLPVWEAGTRNAKGEFVSLNRTYEWKDSAERPADDGSIVWEPVWRVGEGKQVELEHARISAVWPDATLEQLRDEQALLDRLPALMAEFKADMEELGFVY